MVASVTAVNSFTDIGGPSDYAQFYWHNTHALRAPEQRNEIREEVRDALSLVEASHNRESELQRQRTEKSNRINQNILSMFGILILPVTAITGVWGMNISNLPDRTLWEVLAIAGLATGLSAALLVLVVYISKR